MQRRRFAEELSSIHYVTASDPRSRKRQDLAVPGGGTTVIAIVIAA
jgi:hypothetical protein